MQERQHSEQAHGKRKVAQLKRQQFLSLDSQSIRKGLSELPKLLMNDNLIVFQF